MEAVKTSETTFRLAASRTSEPVFLGLKEDGDADPIEGWSLYEMLRAQWAMIMQGD